MRNSVGANCHWIDNSGNLFGKFGSLLSSANSVFAPSFPSEPNGLLESLWRWQIALTRCEV